jgi:hypothetical protein
VKPDYGSPTLRHEEQNDRRTAANKAGGEIEGIRSHRWPPPPGTYQTDIIFFDELSRVNHGYKNILTVISANSRYVYAQPVRKKNDATEAKQKNHR